MVDFANARALKESSANAAIAAYKRAGDGMKSTQSNEKAEEACNFRDLASAQPKRLRPGLLYRSSAFHTEDLRAKADVQAVLDLRRTGKPCRRPTRLAKARSWSLPICLHPPAQLQCLHTVDGTV